MGGPGGLSGLAPAGPVTTGLSKAVMSGSQPHDGGMAALVSAGLAGVGGLYASTRSVVVTVIAVVMVIMLVAMTRSHHGDH